ncbi:MAG: sugar phosphate isomerase/epimerase [Bacillota bacterium]
MELGVQLYTLRKFMDGNENFADLMDWVKDLGCKYIQLSGGKNLDYKEVKKIIDDRDLTITLTHSPYDRIRDDLDALAEEHIHCGIKTIGVGSLPKNFRGDGRVNFNQFIDVMNGASEKLKAYDLNLSYHNHAFEFEPMADGELMMDKLIRELPDLQFVLDTYWVHFAKHSNEEYIKKLNGRLLNVHLKGYRKILGLFPVLCECNRGSLDIAKLLPLFEAAGTQYALIEQDVAKDPKKSVKQSWDYLNSLK